jgi:hypothetical protein
MGCGQRSPANAGRRWLQGRDWALVVMSSLGRTPGLQVMSCVLCVVGEGFKRMKVPGFEVLFEVGQYVRNWDKVYFPLWDLGRFKKTVLMNISVSRK